MKKNDNAILSKTLEHNNNVRQKANEKVKTTMNDIREREGIKTYKERKMDMVNVLNSPKETLSVYAKAVDVDGIDKSEQLLNDITNSGKDLLGQLHRKVNCKKENNKKIITMFPEVKMGGEIIVSSILSPNKLTECQLNYRIEKGFELKDEELQSSILSRISEYIDREYKISDKLPDIVTESLMSSGACPHLILSEAVVDDIVNSDLLASMGMESYAEVMDETISELTKPISLINSDPMHKKELKHYLKEASDKEKDVEDRARSFVKGLVSTEHFNITDNQGIFTLSKLKKNLRSSIIKKSLRSNVSIDMESTDKINYFDLFRDRRNRAEYKPTIIVHDKKEATRKAIGKPLVKKLPTEAVFPVLSLGNKEEHLGYFVLLDENGEPVTSETGQDAFEKLNNALHGETFTSNPITSVYNDLVGEKGNGCIDLERLFAMYEEIMGQQLFDLFKKSVYGEEIAIANAMDFNYISFARSLKAQRTTILYIPKESLVYFAIFHDDSGLGKTLLDDLTTIFSMRAILLFAKVMAQVRNAIDITDVMVQLDPTDPDPDKTMEIIKAGMLKLRANDFPLGENDPHRLLDWIQKAGLKFNFKNHPALPDYDITFDKNNMSYNEPDNEFYEKLGKEAISGMGLPPEVIDQAYSPDFAAGVFQNSALLAKRTTMYQDSLTPEISKFVSAIIYTDENLREELKTLIIKNRGAVTDSLSMSTKVLDNLSEDEFMEYYLDELSKNVYVELPRISEGNINNLQQEFEDYKTRVEAALEIVLNDELFSEENTPGIVEKVKFLRLSLLALFCRRWAADNNYLPELFSIIGNNEEEVQEALESVEVHIGSVYKNVVDLVSSLEKIEKAGGKDLERIKNAGSSDSDSSSSSSSW